MSRPGSDEKTGETRPVSPGAKALGAMEVAARRARESGTSPVPDWRTSTAPEGVEQPTQLVEPPGLGGPPPERRQIGTVPPERWLAVAVGVAALLVVVAAVALAISLSSGSTPVSAPSNTPTTTHTGGTTHTGATAPQSSAQQPGGAPAPSSTTSTLPSLGTPGGAPVISSLSPSSGASGQTLQVSGSNFLSSDGQIVATFGGQVAPTSCPSQTSCTVTVPAKSGQPGAVPVSITTSGGTSNTVTFTYG